MASFSYEPARSQYLQAGLNLLTLDIRAILIDSADYAASPTHEFLTSVPAAARVKVSASLTSKAIIAGAFDCADYVFAIVTGDPSEAILYYVHTGSDATSRLLAYADGFTVTPNGGNINVTVPSDANRAFRI